MKSIKSSTEVNNFYLIIYALISIFIFGVILSVIIGLIYYFTPLKENILPIFTSVILIFSAFWGGKTASQITGSKGLVWGLIIGIILFIIILILTLVLGYTFSFTAILKKLAFCLVGSTLGGVFGVSNL